MVYVTIWIQALALFFLSTAFAIGTYNPSWYSTVATESREAPRLDLITNLGHGLRVSSAPNRLKNFRPQLTIITLVIIGGIEHLSKDSFV